MIDHLGIFTPTELIKPTIDFYVAALAPLGYKKMQEYMDGNIVGLGDGSRPSDFWLSPISVKQDPTATAGNAHFALTAKDRKQVDDFYAKGLEAGGKDNGAPGPRPHYHPDYYAAFLIDPSGNTMEVVTRVKE